MTPKEFKKKLKGADKKWQIEQGTKHEYATHPGKPGVKILIPRGTGELPTGTLDKMLKDAGLK